MRGRKPAPTILKQLHGVEPRRINHHEPIPEHGLPPSPTHFTQEQAELWNYAVQSAPPGMLKSPDVGLLEAWCVAYSIHRAATAELAREGAITVPGIRDPDRRVAAPQIGIIVEDGSDPVAWVRRAGSSQDYSQPRPHPPPLCRVRTVLATRQARSTVTSQYPSNRAEHRSAPSFSA
jgi:hypothetical protein